MKTKASNHIIDVIAGIALIIFGIFFYLETLTLPKSRYEQLGPAFVPKYLSLLLIAFAFIVLVQGIRKIIKQQKHAGEEAVVPSENPENGQQAKPFTKRPGLAVLAVLITFIFVTALQFKVRFFIATPIYVLLLGTLFYRREQKGEKTRFFIVLIVIALFMGFGLFYIFTRVFTVDLP